MRSARQVRQEYKTVCTEMKRLAAKNGGTPLAKDSDLYCRLGAVKNTLEWVHPLLIRTVAKGPDRLNELLGYRHYALGPTHAEINP